MPLIRGDFGKIAQIGLEEKKKGDRVGKGSKEPQHAFVCLSRRGAAAAAGEAQELLLSYCSTSELLLHIAKLLFNITKHYHTLQSYYSSRLGTALILWCPLYVPQPVRSPQSCE